MLAVVRTAAAKTRMRWGHRPSAAHCASAPSTIPTCPFSLALATIGYACGAYIVFASKAKVALHVVVPSMRSSWRQSQASLGACIPLNRLQGHNIFNSKDAPLLRTVRSHRMRRQRQGNRRVFGRSPFQALVKTQLQRVLNEVMRKSQQPICLPILGQRVDPILGLLMFHRAGVAARTPRCKVQRQGRCMQTLIHGPQQD